MKIFVTGGTGFIGSHFLREGLAQGHEIVALRRSSQSNPRIHLKVEPQWLTKSMMDVEVADLEGCECVVHLAAHSTNVPYDSLENCIFHNVLAPLHFFRVAAASGIKRFVVAGSCFEYGKAGERYEFIPPDAPLEPTQTYPASKAMASIAFSQLAIELGLCLSIHRIFQVFGEGESDGRLWPSLRRAALAGKDLGMTPSQQIRDFIAVEQVASQLLDAANTPGLGASSPVIINVGSGKPQTVRSFAEIWWARWNAQGRLRIGEQPYRKNEVMRYVPEITRV